MPIVELDQVADKSFDYVIIGGGTAGLTVATRLSEDSNKSILVLEAGQDHVDDPNILQTALYASHFGQDKYDWGFKTVPQKYGGNNVTAWNRGKGLGGSSAINFSCWTKPPRQDIDDWEVLGNAGWNWDELEKYYEKASTFIPSKLSDQELFKRGDHYKQLWASGFGNGPIKVAHPATLSDIDIKVAETYRRLGIEPSRNPSNGDTSGMYLGPNALDPAKNHRSYAANEYFYPNKDRPNLTVLLTAYATKIVTTNPKGGVVTATAVEFAHGDPENFHRKYLVRAKKEVILAAGALKSPQLLELSGIGRRDVLRKIGVPLKVDLEGVGENVQEHLYTGITFELDENEPDETFDLLRDEVQASRHKELFAQGKGVLTMGFTTFVFKPLDDLSDRAPEVFDNARAYIKQLKEEGKINKTLEDQYERHLDRLERKGPCCEFIVFPGFLSFPNPPAPGKRYMSWVLATNHLFSRGTIHSTTNDPKIHPEYDPHYWEHDIDTKTFIDMVRWARKVANSEPLRSKLAKKDGKLVEVNPGPEKQTDEEIGDWLKKYSATTYHTSSCLSMLPREKGGCVDTSLKVYGTSNIRCVDLSIFPINFAAHPLSTVYAVAEKAADIIKAEAK
ncbi:alcohol oxidase [Schizophyllum commune H4-8]|uniref:Glucose-methanol-choline oxidoreductase N-terminal domain-containing protein n=1 Tax=Schizophyllum commune (strain H4-8 / FGSC 9210) TaxID=578458 RepID=D8PRF3_SCHCM|nr:alcohol oxidase [Schizophyllum commune H4-8]KAI5897977.1 alcohol oxidase [Schizophyllum commune H4-8]